MGLKEHQLHPALQKECVRGDITTGMLPRYILNGRCRLSKSRLYGRGNAHGALRVDANVFADHGNLVLNCSVSQLSSCVPGSQGLAHA